MAQFQDYLIATKTANVANAGMDNITPYVTLGGFFGTATRYALNASTSIAVTSAITFNNNVLVPVTPNNGNKFEQNQWDVFKIRTNNVGTLMRILVQKSGTDAWLLEKIVVIPYKADGNLDTGQYKTFTANRWLDSADFDNLTELTIDADQLLNSPTWTLGSVAKIAKTMVMRYDNTLGSTPVTTTLTCHYSLVQGAAIEKNQTTSTTTSTGVSATVSFEGSIGPVDTSASVTTSFSRDVTKSCEDKCGTSTTSTQEQTQEIPIEVPANAAVTLIVQVYQTVVTHNVAYGGYQVPITVYSPNSEVYFKLYSGTLDAATANARSAEMANLVGAIIG